MKKRFEILLTSEQEKILDAKAKSYGFHHKGEYIRFIIFIELSIVDKINAMYDKVVKNAK